MITNLLLIAGILALSAIAGPRIATRVAYGKLIRDPRLPELLLRNRARGATLSADGVLHVGDLPHIGIVPFDVMARYYIAGVGPIPRGSLADRIVRDMWCELMADAECCGKPDIFAELPNK